MYHINLGTPNNKKMKLFINVNMDIKILLSF